MNSSSIQHQQHQQLLCVFQNHHHHHHLESILKGQDLTNKTKVTPPTTKTPEIVINQFVTSETGGNTNNRLAISAETNHLRDPYIDAVQVRTRSDPVRAGASMRAGHQSSPLMEPKESQSYYKKSVHLEEKKKASSSWDVKTDDVYDMSDDDSDDSDSDDDGDHDDRHSKGVYDHSKGKGKKKRIYVKKKKSGHGKSPYHGKKRSRKRSKYHHHHHQHGQYHHDNYHNRDHHRHEMKKKKEEKKKLPHYEKPERVVYKARVIYKPHKGANKYHDDDKNHGYDDDDHHDPHGAGKPKVKLIYLEGSQKHSHGKYVAKNKMRLAGLLGYTLLCVNYLLVARQSSHHHHHSAYPHHHYDSPHDQGHYFSTYSPKGMRPSGPVILAHCSELTAPAHLLAPAASSTTNLSTTTTTTTSKLLASSESNSLQRRLAASTDHYYSLFAAGGGSAANQQPAPILAAARNPPAFYYTLAPPQSAAHLDQRAAVGQQQNFISPIQDYLNRIFLPTSEQQAVSHRNNAQRFLTTTTNGAANNDDVNGDPLVDLRRAGRVPLTASRLILLDGGGGQQQQQPQVVGTRDNLAGLRARQTDISMRVTNRSRFVGGPQRQSMRLLITDAPRIGSVLPPSSPSPNEAPTDRMQADQPQQADSNENNNNNNGGSSSPSNNLVLDLPEFALAGDSIQLTCNHRIPQQRLYSVKWFKDSLEFYRFIPANGPRSKSALFLPEIRLDLQRSNADALFLRNVTHRSSGLYRCEAVSGKPLSLSLDQ